MSSLIHGLFRSMLCLLISKYGEISCCLLLDFCFDSIMVREHALYDFKSFKFVEDCLIAMDMTYFEEVFFSYFPFL